MMETYLFVKTSFGMFFYYRPRSGVRNIVLKSDENAGLSIFFLRSSFFVSFHLSLGSNFSLVSLSKLRLVRKFHNCANSNSSNAFRWLHESNFKLQSSSVVYTVIIFPFFAEPTGDKVAEDVRTFPQIEVA
jgi:hypothetical protein